MRSTTTRATALAIAACVVASCSSDSESTATTAAATTAPAPSTTEAATPVDSNTGAFTESDLVYATFDGAPLKLNMHFPADPTEAPLVFTSWDETVEDLVAGGAIAVTQTDEEADGIELCPDDIWADHGACLRTAADLEACTTKFARARAAELGNTDPAVVLTGFSMGSGNATHVSLFGATLEERWDEFAQAGGPPRRVQCEVIDGTTHVDAVIGMGGVVDLWVPIIDGKYGRAYQRDRDPLLQEFLASPIGTDADLRVRLILGTRDEFPMEWLHEFASILDEHGYDVQVIPFEGGHVVPPAELFHATIEEVLDQRPTEAAVDAFPEGEPIDLVYIADSSSVGEPYAELAAEALDREVRLNQRVEANPRAIRNRYADEVAAAEIIVFYFNAAAFERDMPAPTFEPGCLAGVDALEDPDYEGPPWTPGTKWEPVAAVPTVEDWQPYREWLSDVWEAIWDARDGRPVVLRGHDMFNPWYGQWVELGIEQECTAIWEGQANAARAAAEANGARFVSFYDVLNGPGHDEDARAKGYVWEDGMHANDAGAMVAAEALAAVGFELNERPG